MKHLQLTAVIILLFSFTSHSQHISVDSAVNVISSDSASLEIINTDGFYIGDLAQEKVPFSISYTTSSGNLTGQLIMDNNSIYSRLIQPDTVQPWDLEIQRDGARTFFGGPIRALYGDSLYVQDQLVPSELTFIDVEDIDLNSPSVLTIPGSGGVEMVFDNNEIMVRKDGEARTLYLQNSGGNVSVGGRLISDTILIETSSDLDVSDPAAHFAIQGSGGTEMAFDNNEIMVRLNGSARPLYLQQHGGELHTGGAAFKPGGGNWTASSDRRLKKNISSFTDGLDEIMQVRPVNFEYKEVPGEYVGIIAQEMQQIAPYMIDDSGEYLTYDGTALTYMLVNAVQEQQNIIERQQEQIDMLISEIENLKNK